MNPIKRAFLTVKFILTDAPDASPNTAKLTGRTSGRESKQA